ncbi:short chain dehydrogenase [Salpingoeca rosetta]|uniref:Short chain dehydrogenase n=1 Tax=Salpingoeca rosetta (strain ATCC 50818 / BSB-021) TaxID=946362 RepID=F2UDZ8_SALR5|nr:short chain dehydrogenase [Salpingoeca rosetta]EGD74848.1 short chain dehydrogenase [Salpingoeca rosetta]|eukprot:XP_004992493.1 short chain dehydrogenase [Salpingoeca rosetta]
MGALSGVRTALVQGGTRGIGLEFVKRLAAQPHVETVFATGRSAASNLNGGGSKDSDGNSMLMIDPVLAKKVVPVHVDIREEDSIKAASEQVKAACGGRLHFVLNASGFLHRAHDGVGPERKLADVRPELIHDNFSVNAFAPILWAKHLAPLLKHKEPAVFASISARVGSISDNGMGGWFSYRASKAAQNMYMRCLAIEWRRTHKNVTVLSLHPGTVSTDLSAPFVGNVRPEKLFTTEQSVNHLWNVMDATTPADTGKFLAWDGKEIPF